MRATLVEHSTLILLILMADNNEGNGGRAQENGIGSPGGHNGSRGDNNAVG